MNMKITRAIDKQGRIMIPKKILEAIGIETGGKVMVELTEDNELIISPKETIKKKCRYCGTETEVELRIGDEYEPVCVSCLEKIVLTAAKGGMKDED